MKLLILSVFCSALFAAAAPSPIHIPVEQYRLKNGLRVVLSQDNTLPAVAVYLVYDVGARSEEHGRTGFAHLFEHMMFEGSANVKKGEHMRYVEANGGEMNGSTHPDYTDYFEVLPSNKLPLALWLESDRMKSLAITPENLANQKEAVKQERRLRMDNQPYVTAIVDVWPTLVFKNWQSSHSLIGSFDDLNAATVGDVSKFFKTYYAPNNAVLSIVGDIHPEETKKLVEEYFGGIPAQPQPKRPDLSEPSAQTANTRTYDDPLAKVPAVVIGYPAPERGSDDFYGMAMLDLLLTGGDSSRLQLDLVKGKKSVVQYEASAGWPFERFEDYKDPGDYATMLVYKPDLKSEQVVDQYQAVVSDIARNGVNPDDLHRAQAMLMNRRLQELQTVLGRAKLLAGFELRDGKPEEINTFLDRFTSVTPQQVQAVADKYLQPDKRIVLAILPAPPKEEGKTKGGL